MDEAIGTVVGAIIGAGAATGAGWLSHRSERIRSEAEWFREKLLEAYSNCIYYLIKLSISSVSGSTNDKDVRQHYCEAQRYLNLLRAYHSEEDTGSLMESSKLLADNSEETSSLSAEAGKTLVVVKELLENDQRIRPVKGRRMRG